MLYIVFQAPSGSSVEKSWHVGEKLPHDLLHGKTVIGVQADGHELDYVRENFANIPYAKECGVQRWRGDIATFIADHLPVKYNED